MISSNLVDTYRNVMQKKVGYLNANIFAKLVLSRAHLCSPVYVKCTCIYIYSICCICLIYVYIVYVGSTGWTVYYRKSVLHLLK